jgi:multiple sugar transport system permease protein
VSLDGYERVFAGTDLPVWPGNSVLVTAVVTAGRVLLDSMAVRGANEGSNKGRTGG